MKQKPVKLDTVENTTIKLLKKGYTVLEISDILCLNMAPVIEGLIYKGVLHPDTKLKEAYKWQALQKW